MRGLLRCVELTRDRTRRQATECRLAVWYSAIAGLRDAEIKRHDDDMLWIGPHG